MIEKGKGNLMKRFISVLSGLLVLPAFAEVAPVYYDEVVEYSDDAAVAEDSAESVAQKNGGQRTNINRSTSATRAISSGATTSSRTNTASRAVASSPHLGQPVALWRVPRQKHLGLQHEPTRPLHVRLLRVTPKLLNL